MPKTNIYAGPKTYLSLYLINILPTSSLNFSVPYHAFFKQFPNYTFLKTFGYACFPLLKPYNNHKLDFKSHECLFLGYSTSHKGYKCLSPFGRIYSSQDVLFNKSKFPYVDLFESSLSLSQNCSFPTNFNFLSIPIIATNQPHVSPLHT